MLIKKGRHLSKSTYHFFIPFTFFLSGEIAKGGPASSQTRQVAQKSSTPCSNGFERGSGASVRTADNLSDDSN